MTTDIDELIGLPHVQQLDLVDDEQFAAVFIAYAKEAEDALQSVRSLLRERARVSTSMSSFDEAKARHELLGLCLQAQDNLRFYRARLGRVRSTNPHAVCLGTGSQKPAKPQAVYIERAGPQGWEGGDAS